MDDGKIDEEQFNQQNERLLHRTQELQTKLAALEDDLEQGEQLEVTLAEVRQALRDFPARIIHEGILKSA